MANYAVSDYVTVSDSVDIVLGLLETQIATIDNTKVLRYIDIIPQTDGNFKGVIIYDT